MARARIENREQISREIRSQVFYDGGKRCAHCGKPMEIDGEFTLEHVIPLAKGGTNTKDNLVALCETCNKAKGDNVVDPYTYYRYLSEKRRCELKIRFDRYMASMDYLTMRNVFPTDEFDIRANTGYLMKSGRVVFKKNTYHVAKLRPVAALEWMTEYKAYLPERMRKYIIKDVAGMGGTSFYAMTQSDGKTILVFSAEIAPINLSTSRPEEGGPDNARNTILLQVFMSHEIKPTIAHCATLYNALGSIINYISGSLAARTADSAIDIAIETPNGDDLGAGTLDQYPRQSPKSWMPYARGTDEDEKVVLGIRSVIYTGTVPMRFQVDGETSFIDIDAYRSGIESRIEASENSVAIKPPEKIKHVHNHKHKSRRR